MRARGLETVHVGELGMATASDESILEHARKEVLVVITLDADFHSVLALSGASAPSVVRLRVQGLKAQEASQLIESVVAKAKDELATGALVSATKKLIRIKRLPIKK
ncbi:MAG TPA: DUF5615 family PIN-like protein [Bryobacteraceae bacterium]|nr:DUF5615 family PIN-like protein [Bryobacteraceae bacterium]